MELCREQSANITSVKFPTSRQTNSQSHNYNKAMTEASGDNAENETDNTNKPKQVCLSFLSFSLFLYHTNVNVDIYVIEYIFTY